MERLLFGAIVACPFQQAFTLPVGFPLKISEILIGFAAVLVVIERRGAARRPGNKNLLFIAVAVLVSTAANISVAVPFESLTGYDLGFTLDLVQYAFYAFLVLAAAWLCSAHLSSKDIGRSFGLAVRVAALYSAVQLAAYLAGAQDALAVVSGNTQVGRSYGLALPRNGPFLEGNYLGFFAGAALLICFGRGDRTGVGCAAGLLVYAQSTSAFLAVFTAVAVILLFRPTSQFVTLLIGAGLAGAILFTFVPAAQSFADVQLAKLGLGDETDIVQNATQSRDGRTDAAKAAYAMALEYPVVGVGPGRFGVYNDRILDSTGRPIHTVSSARRPIVNNGYGQIAAEIGIPALLALGAMLAGLAKRARRKDPSILGLAAFVIVGFNTAPSWTTIAAWLAIAFLMASTAPSAVSADRELDGNPAVA